MSNSAPHLTTDGSVPRSIPRRPMLRGPVPFALFATSYTPLFVLIVLRQLAAGSEFLHWGGASLQALGVFLAHFGVSAVLVCISVAGAIAVVIFMRNVAGDAVRNGIRIDVTEVRNRNSESVSYIGTYIIPFLFEDYSSFYSVAALVILLGVIYAIYVNSTLVLINPLLNLYYSLYEIEYRDGRAATEGQPGRQKTAMVITRNRFLEEGDVMLVRSLGRKLFFGSPNA